METPVHKVVTVFGTRPEAIKLAPVLSALSRSRETFHCVNVISSQHKELLLPFLDLFQVPIAHDLDVMSAAQTPLTVLTRTMERLTPILNKEKPDMVLVQGDTSTALGAAIAAFHAGIAIGHVEAGLRSGNALSPFPEEMNRRMITRMAALNFAATDYNRQTLLAEGVGQETIFVTGNPVVDALQAIVRTTVISAPLQSKLEALKGQRLVVLTTHRRESFGDVMDGNLRELAAFVQQHDDLALVFPVHPNPSVMRAVKEILPQHSRILLLEPLGYPDFIKLLERSWLIVSDSGGVQEEAPSLGRPLLVLRENTERPEGLAAGTSRLVGGDPLELRRMLNEAYAPESWAQQNGHVANPFGDGHAAQRVVDALTRYFERPRKA